MPRILHLGNIANNAYNNCKYLNRAGKNQHYALNFDNPHVMACPEWEEIDTFDQIKEFAPSWERFDFIKPEWYEYVETSSLTVEGTSRATPFYRIFLKRRNLAYWLKDQGLKKAGRKLSLPASWKGKLKIVFALPLYITLHILHSINLKLEKYQSKTSTDLTGYSLISVKLANRVKGFDLIQAYGADIIIPYLLRLPFIAYEHGTLRELPFDGTPRATQLRAAYKNAKLLIITNPDVILSARRLDLKNYIYIPHAVDCNRFKPCKESALLRTKLEIGDSLVILAPARQNWDVKGNHRYIDAFAELIKKVPNCLLFICDWGQHRDLTKDLVAKLNLSRYVHYYSPCPKLTSVHYYQLADIVVDQFEAGAFGGITPEAMACEKPILVHYNPSVHDWCFNSHPPVINVRSVSEIVSAFIMLATDRKKRLEFGKLGRNWVLKEYSTTQLIERHNKIYSHFLSHKL